MKNTVKQEGRLNIVNRDQYPQFKPSPKTDFLMKYRINSVQLKRISHEKKFEELAKKKLRSTIEITDSELLLNNNKRSLNGIFSPYYGSDTTTESPVYSCDCRRLTGGTNIGRVCPYCHTEVRSIEADLRTTMYIDISPYHVLTYHGYNMLGKAMKNLDDILKSVKRINKKGEVIDDGKPTIMDLYDDYNDLYKEKVKLDRDIVFTSKIPVYSARLRPLMQYGMNLSVLSVNKDYLNIAKSRDTIRTAPLIQVNKQTVAIQRTLNEIQKSFISVCDHVIGQISGKKGVFRRSLASGRVDNSSRMVISLGSDLMSHEIDMPYQAVMVLFEEEIANYLSRLDGISISKAIDEVTANQVTKNEKFVKIINQFLRAGHGAWCLINRNPTISESGIMYSKIRKIHEDGTDMTLHLPQDILALLAADFDGAYCMSFRPLLQECEMWNQLNCWEKLKPICLS